MGEVMGRAPAGPPGLAWVRRGYESYLPCGRCVLESPCPSSRSLSVFSQSSFFLPFSRAIPYKPNIRFSVYIRPVCINALFVPEPFFPTLI